MRIAFWGAQEEGDTARNMLAVAGILALQGEKKSFVLGTRKNEFELDRCLSEPGGMVKEECSYYVLEGMDYLLEKDRQGLLTKECVVESVEEFVDGRLFCLRQGARRASTGRENAQRRVIERVIAEAQELFDFTFVDCGNRQDDWTKRILRQADLVVVNIRQKARPLDWLYLEHNAVSEHFFFLIGDYCRDSVYNRRNLERIYRIPSGQIGVIPYNLEFNQACQHGRLDRFFRGAGGSMRTEKNRYFFDEVGRTVRLMQKNLEGIREN